MLFRRAGPGDRERAEPLLQKFEDDYIPLVWDEWAALEPGGIYLAEVDGAVAGIVCIQFVRPEEAYLAGMRIDPDLQGRGLGTEFARFQVEECRRLGARVARLLTAHDNVRVHRMMATLGFGRVGGWLIGRAPLDWQAMGHSGGPPARESGGAAALAYLAGRSQGAGLPGVVSVPGDPWLLRSLRWEEEKPENCLAVAGGRGGVVTGAALVEVGPDWEGRPTLTVRWALADPGAEEALLWLLHGQALRRQVTGVVYSLPAEMQWVEDWAKGLPGGEGGWSERFAAYEIWL
ncbi:MAG: GNAT family N-acetyltransferase [Firmicutes bacterium]|nr:GNAT family N-acetyltransferase [Bacillota bacterium]